MLQTRLEALEKAYVALQTDCHSKTRKLQLECSLQEKTLQDLEMARVIIEKSPVILFRRLPGNDPRVVYVSENVTRYGYSPDDFTSGRLLFTDIVHPEDRQRILREIRYYEENDVDTYTQTLRFITRGGETRWVEDQTSVVRDESGRKRYYQGVVVDVTQRRLAEERHRKSEAKFRRIVETTGEGFLMMDDSLVIVDVNDAFCRMLGYTRAEVIGKRPFDLATEEFRAFMSARHEQLLSMDYRRTECALQTKSGRVVPVLIHGNTLRDDDGHQMGNIAFVTDLTEQKKALALAGKVQRSLIPRNAPHIEGLDIAGRSDSCDEVGGDYFDYLQDDANEPHRLKAVVGDISGHGVDAALLMTTARAFIRSRAAQEAAPGRAVTLMNRDLCLDMEDTGHFMTLFYMDIEPAARRARWVRAGHEPAQVYDPHQDHFDELLGGGLPLGVKESFVYSDYMLDDLKPGTIIALGTDGIWETRDPAGHFFGKKRFRDVLRENASRSAEEILTAVFAAVHRFSRGIPAEDDITLVIVKVTG
jgi:sigma-B regulation protein RsbU (phosphoserine phosphatase)